MSTITNKNNFIIDVPTLGGGRNTKDSNTLINDIEAVDIENFDFEERGSLKKVAGSVKLNSTAIANTPATAYNGGNGTGGLLVIFVAGLITVGGSGKLESKGTAGGNSTASGTYARSVGGGGSGGGHIDLFYKTLSGSLAHDVSGGAGGTGVTANGGAGGAGSSRATQVSLPNLFGSNFWAFF